MRRARQLTGPNRNCKNNTACVTQTLKTSSSTRASFIRIIKLTNFFFKTSKKSIFEGTGGSAENGSKTWSKCHFLLLYRRKSGQKVGKTQSFTRGFLIFQDGPFFRLFHGFLQFFSFYRFRGTTLAFNEFSHIAYKIFNSVKSVVKSLEPCCRLCNTTFYDSFFEEKDFEAWVKQRRKLAPCCSKNHRRNRQLAQLRLWTFWSAVYSTSELRRSNPTLSEFGKLK